MIPPWPLDCSWRCHCRACRSWPSSNPELEDAVSSVAKCAVHVADLLWYRKKPQSGIIDFTWSSIYPRTCTDLFPRCRPETTVCTTRGPLFRFAQTKIFLGTGLYGYGVVDHTLSNDGDASLDSLLLKPEPGIPCNSKD